ncbi:MAG: hypothetical protein WBZ36_28930 [Candidatus Nitrosopolaris sp.]
MNSKARSPIRFYGGMEFDMKFQGIQIIVASVLGIILLAPGLLTTAVYAFVKITSPVKGQNIPVGNLLISGVSSSNSTNHCTVSVIINGIRPISTSYINRN